MTRPSEPEIQAHSRTPQAAPAGPLGELEAELLRKIVDRLGLTFVAPAAVSSDTPLFNGGLELDSIDALEIGILIEEDYGIVVGPAERDKSVFGTLGNLAQFVRNNLQRDAAQL
jgi:acyl carrier protein